MKKAKPLSDQDITFAKEMVKTGGNIKAAATTAYPDTKKPATKGRMALKRPQVSDLVRALWLKSGIYNDLTNSVRGTLFAERPHNVGEKMVMVPDNEARNRTQEIVLEASQMLGKTQVVVHSDKTLLHWEDEPDWVVRYVSEHGCYPPPNYDPSLETGKEKV